MFFISSPYSCFFCHLSQFVIWILAWVSSLFVDFIAFNFYLLSFLLVFPSFSSICLFMSLCNSIIIFFLFVVSLVLSYNLQIISIINIYINDYLFFYLFVFFLTLFLFLGVCYSGLYKDVLFVFFRLNRCFLCFIWFKILYIIGFLSVFFLTFPLIIRILCFYIFA